MPTTVHPTPQIARLSAGAIWALAITSSCRKVLLEHEAVLVLLECVKKSLAMEVSEEELPEEVRNTYQVSHVTAGQVTRSRCHFYISW